MLRKHLNEKIKEEFSSAGLVSRYRPMAPIIAITRQEQAARQMHLFRGVHPIFYTGLFILCVGELR